MIQFANTETSAEFILTLTELTTVPEPVYDFVFTHVLTKEKVSFTLSAAADLSGYRSRYNSFLIDVTQFHEVGEWHYIVTEQQTGTLLESGKMIITRVFNYTQYAGTTSYTAYSG